MDCRPKFPDHLIRQVATNVTPTISVGKCPTPDVQRHPQQLQLGVHTDPFIRFIWSKWKPWALAQQRLRQQTRSMAAERLQRFARMLAARQTGIRTHQRTIDRLRRELEMAWQTASDLPNKDSTEHDTATEHDEDDEHDDSQPVRDLEAVRLVFPTHRGMIPAGVALDWPPGAMLPVFTLWQWSWSTERWEPKPIPASSQQATSQATG